MHGENSLRRPNRLGPKSYEHALEEVKARKLPIQRKKEQAPFSPGESAPADRALVSVELLGV